MLLGSCSLTPELESSAQLMCKFLDCGRKKTPPRHGGIEPRTFLLCTCRVSDSCGEEEGRQLLPVCLKHGFISVLHPAVLATRPPV